MFGEIEVEVKALGGVYVVRNRFDLRLRPWSVQWLGSLASLDGVG